MATLISYKFSHDPSLQSFTNSPQAYLSANRNLSFTFLATATLIFTKPVSSAPNPRVLLLQRAPHDSNPNKWEPPGGACDDTDASILHAAARELFEETSLQAERFVSVVGDPYVFKLRSGKVVGRFYYLVEVDDVKSVKLDPNEHQDYVWVGEAEVREGRRATGEKIEITAKEVVDLILKGFEMVKQ